MSSLNYVAHQLQELGLSAEINGDTIYCEDMDLDFDRSHDGVRGVSRWLVETREEYAEVIRELHESPKAVEDFPEETPEEPWAYEEAMGHPLGEEPEEEPMTDDLLEKAQDEAEEFAPTPPEKEHVIDSAQLALAKKMNMSPKETAQAAEVDDQDRGGIPNPYTQDMSAVVVLVKGQRFVAPEGWKIKESRPSGKVLHYGSIYRTRKTKNETRGAAFSLVRV